MKKAGIIAVILMAASTLVLLVLFVLKAIDNNKQLALISQTETAAAATNWAEQTIAAIPTETPLPTSTATPEPSPTAPPPTPTEAATATEEVIVIEGCDEAAFLADVTIPDGKELDPDTKFTKTWKLLNAGSCTWNLYYKLYFVSGDKMSGPSSQQLVPFDVPPGASIDVSVELRAPDEPGKYRGYWGLKNTNGVEFGIGPSGQPFYVQITVVE